MARFRCPDSRDDLVSSTEKPVAGPSKAPKVRAVAKAKGKVKRPTTQAEAKERIRHARKARTIHKPRPFREIWVGNLPSDTTEKQLTDVFDACGKISEVVIRVSQGSAVSPVEGSKERLPDNQLYASVTFHKPQSARNAMKKNGKLFNGQKMVVRRDVYELPEFKATIQEYVDAQEPQSSCSTVERGWNQLRMWTVDRTQYIPADGKSTGDAQGWLGKAVKKMFPTGD